MPKVADKVFPVDLPFPIKGVDQGAPRHAMPPGTCIDMRNCDSSGPYSDQAGGGKRAGSRRAFITQVHGTGTDRILNLSGMSVGTSSGLAPIRSAFSRPDGTLASVGVSTTPVGAATRHECIDEAVANGATDYINFATPTGDGATAVFNGSMSDILAPGASDVLTMRWSTRTNVGASDTHTATGSGSMSFVINLYCGATFVATSGELAYASEGDWVEGSHVLAAAERALITDWTDLRVNMIASFVGDLATVTADCTWFCFEDAPPASTVSSRSTLILIQTTESAYIGSLETDQITPPSTTGMTRSLPQAEPFRGNTANTSALRWYSVDGDKSKRILYQGITVAPTVTDWAAEANLQAGSTVFPTGCRLVRAFLGAMYLARQEGSDPNDGLWYRSARGDPLNFEFGADDELPAEDAAIAGTNSLIGRPSDSIVAMAAWGDDYLLFLCAGSLWYLTGDPGRGGQIIPLSLNTGCIAQRGWCFDSTGVFWFLGPSGLYRLEKGGMPQKVSGRRLYATLDRLDSANVLIQLEYDAFANRIIIHLTPNSNPQANANQAWPVYETGYACHIRYDIADDSFAFYDYPWNPMGPYSTCPLAGQSDDDRRFLFGGNDGYIRRPFDGGKIDGVQVYGTADDMPRSGVSQSPAASGQCYPITSSVTYAPIESPFAEREIMTIGIEPYGTSPGGRLNLPLGAVRWNWLAADSPGKVADLVNPPTAAATGLWFQTDSGLQAVSGLRVRAGAHALQVVQTKNATGSWGLGRITVYFKAAGRRRPV